MPRIIRSSLLALFVLVNLAAPLSIPSCFASSTQAANPSISQPGEKPSPIMRKGPYLIYNSRNTNMTIMWQTYATPLKATVEWGHAASYGNGPVNVLEHGVGIDGHQFSYTMGNLTPGARVYYRVTIDNTPFTGSFLAAPPHSATLLTFYAYGDSWSNVEAHNSLMKKLLEDKSANADRRQTMILHPGDYVSYGLSEYFWDVELFDRTITYTAESLGQFPFMGVLGVREGYIAPLGAPYLLPQNMGQYYRKYFPYIMYRQTNHSYYSFDYGPAHVAVVDTWSYPVEENRRLPDAKQILWLTQDLKISQKPWKFVMLHAPLWDSKHQSKDLRNALVPIIESSGAHVVLQGHGRYYSHVKKDGITYLTLGGGGAPLNDPAPYDSESAPHVVKSEKAYHFARFEIMGNTMTVTVMRLDGSVIETFSVMR